MRDMKNTVRLTDSGLFIRAEEEMGLLVYSPYSGLIFLVHPEDAQSTFSWLKRESDKPPSDPILNALGVGWDGNVSDGKFGATHYLGDRWDRFPFTTNFPILINWFLTGKCPLACKYCDASDLMWDERPEPTADDVKRIAGSILSYNPLAVVLTGGEPLLSPYLEECIGLLHGRTGIIVDTNGIYLDRHHIRLFKRYQVVVRISIDSPLPAYNDKIRCFSKNGAPSIDRRKASSLGSALQALCLCLEEGVPVSVQTVAVKKTINDLPTFGDRLYKLGIRSWRVHLVLLSKQKAHLRKSLEVTPRSRHNTLSKLLRNRWQCMDFQVLDDISRNSVVIVSTDGLFITESNAGTGKIVIDQRNPKAPAFETIFRAVSQDAHARRYLGDQSIQFRGQ